MEAPHEFVTYWPGGFVGKSFENVNRQLRMSTADDSDRRRYLPSGAIDLSKRYENRERSIIQRQNLRTDPKKISNDKHLHLNVLICFILLLNCQTMA